MDLTELNVLSKAKANDFSIQHHVGSGQNGLVVAAKCNLKGLQDPNKLYAVKLLFNFTHEYSSVVSNSYENEWLLLSRLLPHDNIVRFWTQFISTIPEEFVKLLPVEMQRFAFRKNHEGQYIPTKGQFIVLDYHSKDLSSWVLERSFPSPFEIVLKFTEKILEAVLFLETNCIRHLDLKLGNLLTTENEDVVVCDFGLAVKFADDTFTLSYTRGMLPGGNRAHLAPEVLNTYHKCRQGQVQSGE